jgi:hypothetical protein
MPPGERQRPGVPDLSAVKDSYVGGPASQLDQCGSQFPLIRRQHRERGSQRLKDEFGDVVPGSLDALAEVLGDARKDGDQVNLGVEPCASHSDRLADAGLEIHQVVLRDRVQQLVLPPQGDAARYIVHPGDITSANFSPGDGHDTARVLSRHVLSRQPAVHRADLDAGHPLRVVHGLRDGAGTRFDISHHPAAHAGAPFRADAKDPGIGMLGIA